MQWFSKIETICVVINYSVVFFRVEEGNRNIEISLRYAKNHEKEFEIFGYSFLSVY